MDDISAGEGDFDRLADRQVQLIGCVYPASVGGNIGYPPPPKFAGNLDAQTVGIGLLRFAGPHQSEAVNQECGENDDREGQTHGHYEPLA